jgi:lambda family phage portal protein
MIADMVVSRAKGRGVIDRLIAWVRGDAKPKARARLGYDGSKSNRLNHDWQTTGSDANAEINGALRSLRNRTRDLSRNNPHGARAKEALVGNVISTGIRAKWQRRVNGKLVAAPDAQGLWDEWTEQCSVDNDLDFYGMQALAFGTFFDGGECLARRRWRRPEDGLAVPLQIELLEGDFIDDSKTSITQTGRIVQGVEFDPIGRRSAYWLYSTHPGATGLLGGGNTSAPVGASDIAHLYRPTRAGQVRGVPWLATVIEALRNLGQYQAAERIRKRSQAGLVGVIIPADDATYEDDTDSAGVAATDSSGKVVDDVEPGQLLVARNGKDIRFTSPSSDAGFGEFVMNALRAIGAGVSLPYEVLSQDLSQVNYSSIRLGLVEFQRLVKMLQLHNVIPLFCRPIARWWLDTARAAGLLQGDLVVKWVLPEREEIDRETAVKSAISRIRAGLSSRRDEVAAAGGDADEVVAEIAADLDALDALGITLDTDPRHPATGPLQQPATPAEATP